MENPRLALLVGKHGWRLVTALVVVALVAFAVTGVAATSTETRTVTQDAQVQSVDTDVTERAVVSANDTLWPAGTVLHDKPVYLVNATPNVTLSAVTTVDGASSATITHTWSLQVRATREGDAFWSDSRVLAERTHETATARTNATVSVPRLQRRVASAQERVGDAGVVVARLLLVTDYETGQYEGRMRTNATVDLDRWSYAVEGSLEDRASHSTPVQTEVAVPPDTSRLYGSALVGVLALVLAGGIVLQRPNDIDVETARTRYHERQYAQWISHGNIPMYSDHDFIELDSLENVVDVAIDMNARVVHDKRSGLYAVFVNDIVYYYSPGGSWTETAFPTLGGDDEFGGGGGDFGGDGDFGGGDDLAGGDFEDAFDEVEIPDDVGPDGGTAPDAVDPDGGFSFGDVDGDDVSDDDTD